jgi:glyoxylate/hydroxypyruvate reductase A
MKIVLVGEIDDIWRRELRAAMPEANWDADATQADVAVVANPPPGALSTARRLRLIQSLWAGVDRLLGDASLPLDVPLARMVDPVMNAAMAETALWATLALQRGYFAYARQQRQGLWRVLPQRRADELQVLVLGQGEMGRTAAERLRQQGYRVSGWRRGAELQPLLAHSQIVINLLPLTPQTSALLNARFFAALPPGAAIVNLGRGGHVVDADLLAALDSGHLQHAVLDVFQTEPLPAEHRYWSHPKLTLLPHAAALTDPRSASAVVAANLRALHDGLPLQHLVDRSRGY